MRLFALLIFLAKVFVDTPGMHIGNTKAINAYMNRAASSSINDVDIIP
jgi:GTP-binding protein Era